MTLRTFTPKPSVPPLAVTPPWGCQQPASPGFLKRLLIGVILGPLAETELRRALAISEGAPSVLVSSPITVTVYIFLTGAIVVSVFQHLRHRSNTPVRADADSVTEGSDDMDPASS